jgi:hypothetical protein
MPRKSSIEGHPQADAMVALRREGRPVREIALMFGVGEESLKRFLRPRVEPRPRAEQPQGDGPEPIVARDAAETFRLAFAMEPKAHQVEYLAETQNLAVLKGRQIGMTQAAAALAIHTARSSYGPDVVIVSPSQRQSSEVALRAKMGLWSLGERLEQDSATLVRLANGSRIVSLAGTPRAVRGYSARLLIVDEAAFVTDETWAAARPITSATGGRTVVQSTAGRPVGWFYDLWQEPGPWAQMKVPSEGILDAAYLEEERERLAPDVYAMEYGADFASVAALGRWFTEDEYDQRVDPRFPAIGARR